MWIADVAPVQPLLRLSGLLELRAVGDPDGDILETRPLDLGLRLDLVVTNDDDDVPIVGFRVTGAELPIALAELAPFIDLLIGAPQLQTILDNFQLPLFEDLIDAAGGALFVNNGNPPPPKDYATVPQLLPGGPGTAPCIAAFVARPGTILARGLAVSPVASANELGIGYSEAFLNLSLATGAAAQAGETVDGAEIQSLTLVMGDGVINVDDRAEKSGAEAPEKVRGGLVGTLTNQLSCLVTALSSTDSFAGIEGYAITDNARFEGNGLAFFAEVAISPFVSEIIGARRYRSLWYQKYDSPF